MVLCFQDFFSKKVHKNPFIKIDSDFFLIKLSIHFTSEGHKQCIPLSCTAAMHISVTVTVRRQGPTVRVHFMAGGPQWRSVAPSGAHWQKSAAVGGGGVGEKVYC